MKKYRYIFFPLVIMLFLSACKSTPTVEPPSVETIIAATYAVIKAQTEAAMPTSTPITPTPTEARATLTPFASPTTYIITQVTPTFTITPTPEPTATNITSGSGDVLYACEIISLSPASGSTIEPEEMFRWKVFIKNIGTSKWWPETAMLRFSSGAKYYEDKKAYVESSTNPGEIASFSIKMLSPEEEGTYTSVWSMRKGIHEFCFVKFKIVVKK